MFLLKLSLFQQFCQFYGWILVLHEVWYFLLEKVKVHNRGGIEVWRKFICMQSKQSKKRRERIEKSPTKQQQAPPPWPPPLPAPGVFFVFFLFSWLDVFCSKYCLFLSFFFFLLTAFHRKVALTAIIVIFNWKYNWTRFLAFWSIFWYSWFWYGAYIFETMSLFSNSRNNKNRTRRVAEV